MTDHTRTTAKVASGGIFLTVGGLVLLIVAAHESLFYGVWTAAGQQPVEGDGYGGVTEASNWSLWVGAAGLVAVLAGVWCLVAVVWRIADRVDVGRPGVVHRRGMPLPAATLALPVLPPAAADQDA